MNDIKKIIKLDIISILPYFTIKNLIIILFLYGFYFFITKNPIIAVTMPMIFSMIYSSYPFLIGNTKGIDNLYRIFGIKSKKVVIGRYIFSVFVFIIGIIFTIIFAFISMLLSKNIKVIEILKILPFYLLIYLFIISIQYPLLFKYGYYKVRIIYFITFIMIGIIIFLGKNFIIDLFILINNHILISILTVLIISFIIIKTSIEISEKIYRKKDF
ncbi:MAG: ABC-2 transporter permease [Peptoniphilaceae bacterium]|nr:ABC-2 transporter permease [Peptoniphilaceae bacterium]MDD7383904.1 ABC-2 transporter permease [Peptoniphilaceae bacterium]MDY3738047.1 ABC-2 transporter permease [Peptoniphilaceae bacterium]